MKFPVIALVSCLWINTLAQPESIEKQALSKVQKMSASALDAKLPNRPFAAWLNEVVGPETMVVWQLAECGAPFGRPDGAGQDLPACVEAAVILSNGNRVILTISIGTFKKGIIGEPGFFRAVIENGEQLYQVRLLRDLPGMLRSPGTSSQRALAQRDILPPIEQLPLQAYLTPLTLAPDSLPGRDVIKIEMSPPAQINPPQLQKVSEGVLEGSVISRAMPVYPASARSVNAFGKVQVRILISQAGRVIDAVAISGHPALRGPAVEAARKWVYKATILNGSPVKVETVLTFTFSADAK